MNSTCGGIRWGFNIENDKKLIQNLTRRKSFDSKTAFLKKVFLQNIVFFKKSTKDAYFDVFRRNNALKREFLIANFSSNSNYFSVLLNILIASWNFQFKIWHVVSFWLRNLTPCEVFLIDLTRCKKIFQYVLRYKFFDSKLGSWFFTFWRKNV